MTIIEDTFSGPLTAVSAAVFELSLVSASVGSLNDSSLLAEQRGIAQVRRRLDAYATAVAGEIAHRSRRELGYAGLAQREGFRSPEALVQHATGSSARDASTMVQVGSLRDGGAPWLAGVASAVSSGELSAAAAQAITAGLGQPVLSQGSHVGAEELTAAAADLLGSADRLNVDELGKRARELRDDLDAAGVVDREKEIHDQRSFKRTRRSNGLSRYTIEPDIETAAFLDDVVDKLMSPRRGGPRFVDPADKAWAEKVSTDPRTQEQYLHDSITDLIRLAVTSGSKESKRIVGSRMPSVRILVSETALASGQGVGRIEGQTVPVSLATVERAACSAGTIAIVFDEHGQVIDLGREQRLYNGPQRLALAARDGGCRVDGCWAPPSMTEAHHIKHWHRDSGGTDLADGILLCRFHHMLLHNNGWEIVRRGGDYWLIPPRAIDPEQTPRPMPTKSAALRDLLGQPAEEGPEPGAPPGAEDSPAGVSPAGVSPAGVSPAGVSPAGVSPNLVGPI